METTGRENTGQTTPIKQVILASAIGSVIEWYDFFLYGVSAALIFSQLFFPNFDPFIGTLLAFGTFAAGFLARPLGGIIFGHYGDRIGRKSMLIITLLVMGIATTIVGLLPTYNAIGIWAPILLLTLRFLQGIGMGGEWGGAILMTAEYAPARKRGFYASLPQAGVPGGQLLATGTVALFAGLLSEEQFLAWGWRVPFLLSIVLVGIGLFIRLKILETPAFRHVRETHTEARIPVLDTLRHYPKGILSVTGLHLTTSTFFYLNTVFVISYATGALEVSRSTILFGVLIANAFFLLTVPAFGALSDHIGRRLVYLGGALLAVLFAFPYFWLIGRSLFVAFLALVVMNLVISSMTGAQSAFFAEQFETRIRYSGISIGFQLATILGGAMMPIIATALLEWSNGSPQPVSAYLLLIALITLSSAFLTKETFRSDIYEKAKERSRD